jgi:F0F1-type ATP synthase gamma subunit
MWTMQQKAEFVLWYTEFKSVVTVQCKWQRLHPGEKALDDKTESLIETVQSNGVLKNINLYVDQKPWKRIETY